LNVPIDKNIINFKMELNSNFIEQYDKLPEDNKYTYGRYINWDIKTKDKLLYFDGSNEKTDFLWQSILFSLFSKLIYNYSPENYKYFEDYLSWNYTTRNQVFQKISRTRFCVFIDKFCADRFPHDYDKFEIRSRNQMVTYAKFFFEIPAKINIPYCQIDLKNLIRKHIQDYSFKEEFSDDENSLSYFFLKTLIAEL